MSDEYAELTAKFRPEALTVYRSGAWVATVRPKQVTLGSLILYPIEYASDFAMLTDPEVASDLFATVGKLQDVISKLFEPDRFNLIAAMMKDPFVHFHLIPRYAEQRQWSGISWSDNEWPALVSFGGPDTGAEVLADLKRAVIAGIERLQ